MPGISEPEEYRVRQQIKLKIVKTYVHCGENFQGKYTHNQRQI